MRLCAANELKPLLGLEKKEKKGAGAPRGKDGQGEGCLTR